jgi:hypothetical protein
MLVPEHFSRRSSFGLFSDTSRERVPKMSPGWPDSSECQANQTENGIHVQFTLAA